MPVEEIYSNVFSFSSLKGLNPSRLGGENLTDHSTDAYVVFPHFLNYFMHPVMLPIAFHTSNLFALDVNRTSLRSSCWSFLQFSLRLLRLILLLLFSKSLRECDSSIDAPFTTLLSGSTNYFRAPFSLTVTPVALGPPPPMMS
jgi:hypothetical protein